MVLGKTKEYSVVAAVFFGLSVFPVVQGVSALFLQEGIITYWISHSLMIGAKREAVAERPQDPIAPSDDRRPFAVMIDNHQDAWPQSGIDQAEYVHEYLVEGGITRLMAIFRGADAEEIGPVRSARPYFLHIAREYDAVYVHVGGSDEALRILHTDALGLDDDDEFRYGTSFWHDKTRDAPHSTYTSSTKLAALLEARAWRRTADRLPPDVRSDLHPDGMPAIEIVLEASSASLDSVFRWNPDTASYDRILRGKPAMTRMGVPESPKTVVALEIPAVPAYDPFGKGLIAIETVGEGPATVFRDGIAIEGVWKKAEDGQLGVYLASGKKIPYTPSTSLEPGSGQVWFLHYAPNRGGTLEYSSE